MLTRTATRCRAWAVLFPSVAALAALSTAAGPLSAQETEGVNGDRPSVFLDCATRSCNREYFRT